MYEPPRDVVEHIASYMNTSHAATLVAMVTVRGHQADSVIVLDITCTGLLVEICVDASSSTALIPWSRPLQGRDDIRRELFELEEAARFSTLDDMS